MKKHNFRQLNIWIRSMELARGVYALTSELPSEEKFGLKSQINRCAVSIPSNIAEGSGRNTNKDFSRFLDFSLSSSYELETQLILAQDIFQVQIKEIIEDLNEIQKMIAGFRNQLQ